MRIGGKSTILICLLSLSLATAVPAVAAFDNSFYGNYRARFITMEDGLSGNFVDDLLMDSSGFIWVGTSGSGLCRYDGYGFLTFSTNTAVGLKNNFIRKLAEDRWHRLWIASEGGIDVLDLDTCLVSDLSGTPLAPYLNDLCPFLTVDATGCVWVKSGAQLLRVSFDKKGNIASVDAFADEHLSPQTVVFQDVEGDGSVWVGMAGRVRKIVPSPEGLREMPVLEGFSYREDAYLSDFQMKEGEVWVSTSDGLFRCSPDGKRWKHYAYDASDPGSLSQNFITGLAISPNKRLIAASLKGFNVFDPIEDSFVRVSSDAFPDLLDSDFINCIKVYGDEIWLGTESAGLVHLYPGRMAVSNVVHDPRDPRSIAANPVNSIYEDAEGRIWVGNVEGGLSISEPGMDGFHHLTVRNSGLSHNSVSAICADDRGRMWIGTWGGGVMILSGDPPFLIEDRLTAGSDSNEWLSYVGALMMDTANELMWISTNMGIYYYDLRTAEVHPALREQTYGCIGACIDASGRLWMGSQEGVFVFDLRHRDPAAADCAFPVVNYRYKLDHPESGAVEKIYSICRASDGSVWLGSYGNGIYHATARDDGSFSFINYGSDDGLVNDGVKCILEDADGRLWVSTENGLSRFSPKTGRFVSYSVRDGLQSAQFYWNAALRSSSGLLYFGSVAGLSIVDPLYRAPDISLSRLHFTRITVGDHLDLSGAPTKLRLHERDRSIGFEFSALTFGPASSVRYSVCLEGQDDDWTTLPLGRNFLNYTSMRKGRYVLRIKATDESGETESVCELPIRVAPYFYHSWVFFLLLGVQIIFGVMVWQDWKMRSLMRQRAELLTAVEERTREINHQKKLLEEKADELSRQNRILTRQNEELAGHRILSQQESRPVESRDEKFISKAIETIREMYKDPELDVPAFCAAMGMSKTLLNNRMQETLGQSTGQFIRTYRLSIAREMLINNNETHSMNISEIAYEVGFNDPKYFTRCFSKEFGFAPSAQP